MKYPCITPHSTVLPSHKNKSVHISNHVFVFFTTDKDIISYGVRSAYFWTLPWNDGYIDIKDQDDHELWLR